MIENKQKISKDLEKALQVLQQAKQRVANEKKKPRIKRAYAEPFTEWREDNAKTVESGNTVLASRV